MKITIDQLIKKLEELKSSPGCSGDTPVFLKKSPYWAHDLHDIKTRSISKNDFERGKGSYDFVSNRGVKVVIIE